MKRLVLGAASGASLGAALAVRLTVRTPVFDAGPSPWLLVSLPSLSWLLVAVVAGGLGGALLARRGLQRLLTPFLVSGLALSIYLPGVFAGAPFLAAFGGRFLDLVLFVGLLLAVGRLGGLVPPLRRAPRGLAVFLVGFALYLAVGLTLSRNVGLSGDEPHFLLVAWSLINDGDIAVQDNYGREDYRHFYHGKIGPHLAAGTPYSVHGIGVPLLLLPGFALGGLAGVVVVEALLAGLLLRTIYSMALAVTGSAAAALFATAGFGLTSPGLFLSVSAYPELPAALVVALVAHRLLDPEPPRRAAALAWALLVGSLPFFHVKFAPLALVLFGMLVFRFGGGRAALRGFAAGALAAALAVALFSLGTTGSFDPTASYGRQRVFLDRIPLGTAGLLFDQEFGLLPSSPVYLLGLAGIASLFRRSPASALLALLALLAVLVPGAAHPLWSGGNSPPARFLFPALPLLMVASSCLLAEERRSGVGPWAPSLLATSLGLAAAMLLLPGQPLFLNSRDGTGQIWEALSSGWNLADYLPSLVRADVRSLVGASALGVVVLAAVAIQARRARVALPPLAGVLLLAAWTQDLTGAQRSRALETRWVSQLMHELASRSGESFLALPPFESLSQREVAERVPLPLEALPRDGDPQHWWSRSYALPAGRFRVSGVSSQGLALCNGEGCFVHDEGEFSSHVALAQFRVRVRALLEPPRLHLLEPRAGNLLALRTLALEGGGRLHGLDDGAYLDPGGFWVKGASRARFALEAGPSPTGRPLRLRNGGAPNRAHVHLPAGRESFRLAPWEEREILVPSEGAVTSFAVQSESGFRPAALDPESPDERELGVFIHESAPVAGNPAFDYFPRVPDNEP